MQVAVKSFTVYLIRHAESENNARPVYDRVCDPAITARGRLQAERLAEWMQSLKLDLVVTSPFLRTLQTTAAILAKRQRPVEVWHDIFETGGCYHGHDPETFIGAEGLGRGAIASHFETTGNSPVVDETILDTGWWGKQPREPIEQTRARAQTVVFRLANRFDGSGQTIALVMHADFKRELLQQLFGDVIRFDAVDLLINTSVTQIHYDGTWKLGCLNSITHLPPRLITGREW